MNTKRLVASLMVSLLASFAHAQGTFLYDQQSADENSFMEGGAFVQLNQPIGQSFTPVLSSVGFVRLYLYDATFADTLNGTLLLYLRTDSINGPILSSTGSVVLPPAFGGTVDFFFSTPVEVTPGAAYYLQLALQSGNSWGLSAAQYNYSGGTLFDNGTANPAKDLWFREGIVAPEPSVASLVLLAGAAVAFCRRKMRDIGS